MFEKLNKQYQNTVKEGIDTDSMEFTKLKEYVGKTIKVDGFFFTKGDYGKQVVVVGNGSKINMPERAVEMFEAIRDDAEMLKAVLEGHLLITNIEPKKAKKGNTVTFELQDC